MKKMDPHKAGLTLGGVLGAWHFFWGLLAMFGMAQMFLDWILWLHLLNNPFVVAPFDPARIGLLVIVTSVIGYVIGWAFASIWNTQMKK